MFQVFSQLQKVENKKATIIVVASKVKEERSSEVQTAFMVITFYQKKTFIPSKPLLSNACEKQKATIIVVALNVKEEQSSEVQTASGPKCRLRLVRSADYVCYSGRDSNPYGREASGF